MDENAVDLEDTKTQENKGSQQDQNVSSSTEAPATNEVPIESTESVEVETENSDDLNDQEIDIEQSQTSEQMIEELAADLETNIEDDVSIVMMSK